MQCDGQRLTGSTVRWPGTSICRGWVYRNIVDNTTAVLHHQDCNKTSNINTLAVILTSNTRVKCKQRIMQKKNQTNFKWLSMLPCIYNIHLKSLWHYNTSHTSKYPVLFKMADILCSDFFLYKIMYDKICLNVFDFFLNKKVSQSNEREHCMH